MVGIFAGVGVLMLVASPFLLLAAPCILFCKCKMSQGCGDDDTSTSAPMILDCPLHDNTSAAAGSLLRMIHVQDVRQMDIRIGL